MTHQQRWNSKGKARAQDMFSLGLQAKDLTQNVNRVAALAMNPDAVDWRLT
jgi:hypothetical protein